MLTFTYCSKGQGEAFILNLKTNAHGFASIPLSLVSSGGLYCIAISHYLASYLYYPIVTCCEIRKQSLF